MANNMMRTPMAQVAHLRTLRKCIAEGNPFAPSAIEMARAGAEAWYLDPRTPPRASKLLQVELDLLDE